MDNIIVEIGANTQEFLAGLTEVGENTDSLGDKLTGVGVIAAAAFAGYTASIMGSVAAYREEELVGQEVNAVIQSTGGIAGVTAQAVQDLADALSQSTTFSKLQVEQGEEVLLTFTNIGKDTFPAATKASLDMAQGMGMSAAGAAQILGRALQDPMTATTRLTREGITFTAQQKAQISAMELAGNIAGAQAIILGQVEQKFGGMATAAAGGTGQLVVLKNSMEDLAAQIGSEFAPYVAAAATKLNELVQYASQHEGIVEFTAAVLAGGAAIAGIVTALVSANFILPQLSAALELATTAVEYFGGATRLAMGATGLGLVIVVAAEAYEHWNTLWPAMQDVFHTFVTTITTACAGIATAVRGAFSLDINQVKAGIAQAVDAFVAGAKQSTATVASLFTATPEARTVAAQAGTDLANAQKRAQIEALQAADRAAKSLLAQSQQDTIQAQILVAQGGSKALIAIKQQEAAALKQLSTSTNAAETAALNAHLNELKQLEQQANTQSLKQQTTFDNLKKTEGLKLTTAEKQQLTGSIKTEQDATHAYQVKLLQDQIDSNNKFLADQAQFGTSYASIDQIMRNTILTQADTSLTQLSQLTQSKNAELKAIGQAASVVDIEIKSAQGAMAAYAGFASIPIVGPALGIAAAAAIELYGQERVAQVLGAAEGGLYTGGIPGTDSIPALYTPGELVVPNQNFEEVVNATASSRNGQGAGQPQQVEVVIAFNGNAGRMLQVQSVRDKSVGVYRGT